MTEDRHESDACVACYAESQPYNHYVEDCAVDAEQEHRKASKEEEKRSMDKYGHCSGHPVKVQLLESLCVEGANAGSVLRIVSALGCHQVGLSPLLYKYCYESASKTHNEAQEPK